MAIIFFLGQVIFHIKEITEKYSHKFLSFNKIKIIN